MVEIKTKYFGKIIFDETKKAEIISVKYGRNILNIGLPFCFINNKDSLNICIEIMNKYKKINRIAKEEIGATSHNRPVYASPLEISIQ